MKLLFLRTPRRYRKNRNSSDDFWMPLSYACLAAWVRQRIPDLSIELIDCGALQIGWREFEQLIRQRQADFVGIGDETIYANDGVRAAQIAKQANPRCAVIAGGRHFPFLPELYLGAGKPFDYLVLGEGEQTFAELLEELMQANPRPEKVRGLLFHDGSEVVRTPFRPVIEDLDRLPFPAYDIMALEVYRRRGRFKAYRNSFPVQRARGCISACTYCSLWPTESSWRLNDDGTPEPIPFHCRTKSVAKTVAELERLYQERGARQFNWTDGTWNVDPSWSDQWATEVLRRKMRFGWSAYFRADMLLRDEQLGILEKQVRTGLNFILIGAERATAAELQRLNKKGHSSDTTIRACQLMARKYPQVWCHTTYLVGMPDETREAMLSVARHALASKADFSTFYFMTPLPGSPLWQEAHERGLVSTEDFDRYDWFTPVLKCSNMTGEEMTALTREMSKKLYTRPEFFKGLLSQHAFKRDQYRWFLRLALVHSLSRIKGLIADRVST